MCLQELMKKRYDIHNQLVLQVHKDTDELAQMAENMAECATNIKGQGYISFIQARDNFMKQLNKFRENYSSLCTPFEKKVS